MAHALNTFSQHCRQETDTAALAQSFAHLLSQSLLARPQQHINLTLQGELGAGKTTFARYLIQGMGYLGRVKSPTYTLCEPYPLQLGSSTTEIIAHHFDLYRMRTPHEWQEAGFTEYFDLPGLCLIEWPEKAGNTLPLMDVQITLSAPDHLQADLAESSREINFIAHTVLGNTLLNQLHAVDR
jgi:tRNA threonylcarbamoyladenosine biosynthesis protein TsaE